MMCVPAPPARIVAALESAPIAAIRPVSVAKRQAASTLGRIEPASNCAGSSSWAKASLRVRCGVVALDVGHVGEQQQRVRLQLAREQRSGTVLVDHRLDAAQRSVLIDEHRDPAAADAHHEHARGHQHPDRRQLDDQHRLR